MFGPLMMKRILQFSSWNKLRRTVQAWPTQGARCVSTGIRNQDEYRTLPVLFPTRVRGERMTVDVGVWDVRPSNTASDDAPLVLALHGVAGSSQDFDVIGRELVTHGIRFVGLDLPGYGKSRLFRRDIYRLDHSTEGMYRMLVIILNTLQISRIDVLMCHSAGAWLGYKAVGDFHLVRSAIFINPLGARNYRTLLPWPLTKLMAAVSRNPILHSVMYKFLPYACKFIGIAVDEDHLPSLPVTLETITNTDFTKFQSYAKKASMRKFPFVMVITKNDNIGEPSIAMEMAHFLGLQEGEITEISSNGTTTVGESVGKYDSICFRRVLFFERGGHVAQRSHMNEIIEHTQQLINVVNKKS